jgi:hypothetical protein
MTEWYLWIDDQLDDPETPVRWTPSGYFGAKSTAEAKKLVDEHGLPRRMDLDHDLGIGKFGEADTVMEFLRWLSERFPNHPPDYAIHSQNPIGVKNIISFMESWKKSLED